MHGQESCEVRPYSAEKEEEEEGMIIFEIHSGLLSIHESSHCGFGQRCHALIKHALTDADNLPNADERTKM